MKIENIDIIFIFVETNNHNVMIKPSDILFHTKTLNAGLRLKITTESGLGNGGFRFSYLEGAEINGMGVSVDIWGVYLNPFGPFKKEFTCYMEFKVEPPYDWKNNPSCKGSYKYCYSHKESFRGKLYSRDAEEICEKLLKRVADYFEYNTEYRYVAGDGDDYTEYKVQYYERKPGFGEVITRQL